MKDEGKLHPVDLRMKRILVWILVGVIVMAALTAVLIFVLWESQIAGKQIEDINGTGNSSLAVITLDEILNTDGDYVSFKSVASNSGAHTRITGFLDDEDWDKCKLECGKITGIKTIQATKVDADELTLRINTTLTSGNMEVFILVDGECVGQAEVNQTDTISLTGISGKEVLVKIAAESAEMKIQVERTYS